MRPLRTKRGREERRREKKKRRNRKVCAQLSKFPISKGPMKEIRGQRSNVNEGGGGMDVEKEEQKPLGSRRELKVSVKWTGSIPSYSLILMGL